MGGIFLKGEVCLCERDFLKIFIVLKIYFGCVLLKVFELARVGSLVKLLYSFYFFCFVWEDVGSLGGGFFLIKRFVNV